MTMLGVHLMQHWFGCSDPAIEDTMGKTTIFLINGPLSTLAKADVSQNYQTTSGLA